MLLEDDFKDDALTLVFFTLTGKFLEYNKEELDDAPFISTKLVLDDVD